MFVYTIWLKRRSPQNIVIGGAAGAVPPLVGWAAVTGGLDPAALYLFAIVFYWTPPHFWALSLLMKDEYARVGVPMMPVVHGESETRRQIVLYTVLLGVLTLLPVVFGFFGAIYGVAALGLGAAFLVLAVRLQRRADRASALRTYLFSLAYLAALFGAMVADARILGSSLTEVPHDDGERVVGALAVPLEDPVGELLGGEAGLERHRVVRRGCRRSRARSRRPARARSSVTRTCGRL